MGLTNNQMNLIKAVAENDIHTAKKCAVLCLDEDKTQKNQYFTKRYKSVLASEGSNLFELPSDLKDILICEDVSLSFHEKRYYPWLITVLYICIIKICDVDLYIISLWL